MNEITGRIREVFEHSGKNQSELARCLKVTPSYIWKLLNKDDVTPSERFIYDICEKFQIRKICLEHGARHTECPLDSQDDLAKITAEPFKGEKHSFKELLILTLAYLVQSDLDMLDNIPLKI